MNGDSESYYSVGWWIALVAPAVAGAISGGTVSWLVGTRVARQAAARQRREALAAEQRAELRKRCDERDALVIEISSHIATLQVADPLHLAEYKWAGVETTLVDRLESAFDEELAATAADVFYRTQQARLGHGGGDKAIEDGEACKVALRHAAASLRKGLEDN